MSVVALIAGAASAHATGGSGGIGGGGGGGGGAGASGTGCSTTEFGQRTLSLGDCGDDVATLNWILKSQSFAKSVPLVDEFEDPTDETVREFQRDQNLSVDGVVDSKTRESLVRTMPKRTATWYGPGFFGNRTACGKRLKRGTVGVAHKRLPCGTKVVVRYKGHFLRTKVIDRGPFDNGAKWDLTQKAARLLGFEVTDAVRVAKIKKR
jgi:rare lipoprotein A (peptidoglycan hydrolase)